MLNAAATAPFVDPAFVLRILLGAFLGALIGMERQWRQRLAGLRTNSLVSLGASAYVAMGCASGNPDAAMRVAAQVVSGIGFLGAGVIFREGLGVRGLNTAATLWCSAAVGALAGMGEVFSATVLASVVVALNLFLRPVAQRINRQPLSEATDVAMAYLLTATCREAAESHVRGLIVQTASAQRLHMRSMKSEDAPAPGRVSVQAELMTDGRQDQVIEQLTSRLSMEPAIVSVAWLKRGQNGTA